MAHHLASLLNLAGCELIDCLALCLLLLCNCRSWLSDNLLGRFSRNWLRLGRRRQAYLWRRHGRRYDARYRRLHRSRSGLCLLGGDLLKKSIDLVFELLRNVLEFLQLGYQLRSRALYETLRHSLHKRGQLLGIVSVQFYSSLLCCLVEKAWLLAEHLYQYLIYEFVDLLIQCDLALALSLWLRLALLRVVSGGGYLHRCWLLLPLQREQFLHGLDFVSGGKSSSHCLSWNRNTMIQLVREHVNEHRLLEGE